MKKLFLLLFSLCSFHIISAQSISKHANQAQQYLDSRGEVYFSFQLNDLSQVSALSRKISISKVLGNTIFAFANQKEFTGFLAFNLNYTVLKAPSELYSVKMTEKSGQVLSWNYYPTYNAYETLMQQFATDHPEICKLITITTLASGRKILALRISDNVKTEENEPEFLYTSSIHGNETAGYILMLHLADYLLTNYGSDERITNLVNNTDIVICPLANPDGTYKGGNNTVKGSTRYNANSIDLNRNYPDPENGPHPDGNAWQPETLAFMDFAKQNTFTMSANFHGGTEVVNYPWDTWPRLSADDVWWQYVSHEYADTVHINAPNDYMKQFNNGITNGSQWYEIDGGRQDYMNYFQHCREATIEISDDFILPENHLISYWNYNYRSFLNYIEQSGYGLRGLVTDSLSGAPLYAKIYISGFDKDSSHVYTDPQVGDYHRLLKGGSYIVTYSASGYLPKNITVQVVEKQANIVDVHLNQSSVGTNFNQAQSKQSEITFYPNPVTDGRLEITSVSPVQFLKITDINGKTVFSSAPKAKNIITKCNWPPGTYIVQAQIKGLWISKNIQVIKP